MNDTWGYLRHIVYSFAFLIYILGIIQCQDIWIFSFFLMTT